jgi:hypothetical protein
MENKYSSETSDDFQRTTLHYISEDRTVQHNSCLSPSEKRLLVRKTLCLSAGYICEVGQIKHVSARIRDRLKIEGHEQ